jgi:hypothetical protein
LAARTFEDLAPELPEDIPMVERWHRLQKAMDECWNRFKREVVPELHKFHKVVNNDDPLKPGDIVIMLDKQNRGEWPLGKVLDSDFSRDGRMRRVRIFRKGAISVRHPRDLCKLVSGEKQNETDKTEETGSEDQPVQGLVTIRL